MSRWGVACILIAAAASTFAVTTIISAVAAESSDSPTGELGTDPYHAHTGLCKSKNRAHSFAGHSHSTQIVYLHTPAELVFAELHDLSSCVVCARRLHDRGTERVPDDLRLERELRRVRMGSRVLRLVRLGLPSRHLCTFQPRARPTRTCSLSSHDHAHEHDCWPGQGHGEKGRGGRLVHALSTPFTSVLPPVFPRGSPSLFPYMRLFPLFTFPRCFPVGKPSVAISKVDHLQRTKTTAPGPAVTTSAICLHRWL